MTKRVLCPLFFLALSCGGPQTGVVETNTNWLESCEVDADCDGPLACHCGLCTHGCGSDEDCEALPGARCVLGDDPATWTTCESREPPLAAGICLPSCTPGSCGNEQACVSGACVSVPLPDSEFCAPVVERSETDRTSEDALLSLLQDVRVDGGAVCGTAPGSPAVPALRVDPRLRCAARVLSVDLEETRNLSIVDSLGRDTPERLSLVGYEPGSWGESYALETTASEALSAMMNDVDSCQRFVNADFLDIGVGASGDSHIVTIGVE
jgi:hypothetical protein